MYFNEKNNETNVDNEFEHKNPFFDFKNVPKPLLIGVGIGGIILLVIIILLLFSNKKTELEYYLTLNGDTDIIIYSGNQYIESGYTASDSEGNEYNDEVEITSNIDYSISGEYTIKYKFKDIEKTRVITVVSNDDIRTFLLLNGSNPLIVYLNGTYEDPGVNVIDSKYTSEEMITRVKTESNVDTSKVGTYKIIYSLVNDAGVTFNLERRVIVTDSAFSVYYAPVEYTSGKVTIVGSALVNDFDYILLPDGNKITDSNFSYDVTSNDSYTFRMYDKSGNYLEKIIDVINIDNEKPTGYCMAIVSSKTDVSVTASDNGDIIQYNYHIDNDSSGYTSNNTYSSDKKADWVNVELKDKAGNVSKIYCDSKVYIDEGSSFTNTLKVKAKDMIKYLSNYSQAQIVTFTAGKISDEYDYGVSSRTGMYLSSGTKTILGIVAAKMQEDGIIRLDNKIDTYWHKLYNYNFDSCSSEWKSIIGNQSSLKRYTNPSKNLCQGGSTLRNALTNSSNIYNLNMIYMVPGDTSSEYFGGGLSRNYTRAAFMLAHTSGQLFNASKKPGTSTDYDYKKDGLTREATLAGTTMQIAMKESLNEYMRKTILSSINAQSNPNFKGGNTIFLGTGYSSSALDYAKIIAAVANDGVYNGNRVFAKETVDEIERVYSNLKNQTIAFDYINGKYIKYGDFRGFSSFDSYNFAEVLNYSSYVSYDPKTSSGFVVVAKFNSKDSRLSRFTAMENYFYSVK